MNNLVKTILATGVCASIIGIMHHFEHSNSEIEYVPDYLIKATKINPTMTNVNLSKLHADIFRLKTGLRDVNNSFLKNVVAVTKGRFNEVVICGNSITFKINGSNLLTMDIVRL